MEYRWLALARRGRPVSLRQYLSGLLFFSENEARWSKILSQVRFLQKISPFDQRLYCCTANNVSQETSRKFSFFSLMLYFRLLFEFSVIDKTRASVLLLLLELSGLTALRMHTVALCRLRYAATSYPHRLLMECRYSTSIFAPPVQWQSRTLVNALGSVLPQTIPQALLKQPSAVPSCSASGNEIRWISPPFQSIQAAQRILHHTLAWLSKRSTTAHFPFRCI